MKNVLSKAVLAALATAATAGAAHAQTAAAPSHTTSWTGTVGEDRFGDARFKMRGRFQYDITSVEWDNGQDDATRSYARRAFLGVQGRLTEHWRYKVDFVLTPSASDIAVDDAFLEYVNDDWSIVIGESNVTSPLEDRISSLDIPFIERSSIINSFGYGRLAGVAFLTGGANWSAAAAVQGDSLNSTEPNFDVDETTSISGRFTFAPIFETTPEGTTLVHLGVHGRLRDTGDNADTNYRPRPFLGRGDRWIGNAAIGDNDTTYGAEAAVQFGPFGAQAEYMVLDGENSAGVGFDASGYYVDVYWSLTGESRNYRGNQGSFAAIAPRRSLADGGPGHWMVSARYDYIDLSDDLFTAGQRGEQSAWAAGLDWVPVDHVRFKLNYASTEMERSAGADTSADVITLRTQFDF